MPETPLTRRQKLTIRIFEDAYMDLLEEHDAKDITIVMLCEAADMNRTTFYRRYIDIEDFRSQMTETLFQQIFSVLTEETSRAPRKKLLYALNVTAKNKRLLHHLLCDSSSNSAEKLLEKNLTIWYDATLGTKCTPDEAALCYAYLCGGIAQVWMQWIESNCKTPKEKVAQILEEIINCYYNMMGSGFILKNP